MKAFMLDMMVAMMPFMKPILWLGVIAAVAGIGLRLARPMLGEASAYNGGVLWAGRIAGILGLFFLMCEVMGYLLGAAPQFNFGDATKFEFIMVPFWWMGAGLLVAAIIIGHGVPKAQTA